MSIVVVGSFVQDYVWQVPALPALGESRIGTFFTGPGGKGFNQAICCHRLGVDTLFIAAIGDDVVATSARATAKASGLPCVWHVSDAPTAAASVVVAADGSNLICVALGANLSLTKAVVAAQSDTLALAKVILTQLETNLSASFTALTIARTAGVLSILNPAPINPLVTLELMALADVLTPNETEFAHLLQVLHGIELPLHWWRAADALLHSWTRELSRLTVVITLGAEGAFVSHAADQLRGDTIPYYRVAPLPAHAIDSTGAGDAFNAGLAVGLVKFSDQSFSSAVHYATQVAALSVERAGAALAMPTAEEVQARWN